MWVMMGMCDEMVNVDKPGPVLHRGLLKISLINIFNGFVQNIKFPLKTVYK